MFEIDFQKPIHVYFMGIGGISMSGLAEILLSRKFTISGSDMKESPLTRQLSEEGARIYYGQQTSHIDDTVDLVVYTAAIHEDNPEFQDALARKLPMLSRAQLLGQLMRNYELPIAVSGTHGKTTTTSMISDVLLACETDPTLTIGGILPSIGGNIRIGHSPYFVTEACEYTNSFLSFFPKISIILNVEEDHMDFFHNIEEIRQSFHHFAALLPGEGTLIINKDIPGLSSICEQLSCRVLRYGFDEDCDCYATDICYDEKGHPSFLLHLGEHPPVRVRLGVPGKHNVSNSLAVFALSDLLGLPFEKTTEALSRFTGTKRRFEFKGKLGDITIIDDYAHHPTEIRATLEAAKAWPHNRLWCIFQPHTYTRTNAFLHEFAQALSLADEIILADIYAAREINTIGITSLDLKKEIEGLGKTCHYFPTFDEIENFLLENSINGDLLITMGAGDIVKIGENLLGI
ncbi:MAG: UDP-N-acetylmuramate--L-alanine ligase [Lachnospiraceae bacterium]|nr:UDP-N-acetylmuramate--L-alanine ligase [Lachnospiraceae bacterium]